MTQPPEITNREIQKRQVAKIVKIADLVSGEYIQQTGWLPNFVKTKSGSEVSRVNIIGALTDIFPADIVSFAAIENFSATLDDGSGKMQLRSFEPIVFADSLQLGIPVLVIARPKKYSGELFLVPEIIRKLPDNRWLEIRKKVLEKESASNDYAHQIKQENQVFTQSVTTTKSHERKSDVVEDKEPMVANQNNAKPPENVLDIIDRIDSGDGVLVIDAVEEIKKSRPEIDAQQRILTLLLNGDLFEIRPGKIKVLK